MLYLPIMKTFDSFLNKCIKTLLVVNIIIILTIGNFFVQPVYADSSFVGQPVDSNLSGYGSYPKEGGLLVGSEGNLPIYVVPNGNNKVPYSAYFFVVGGFLYAAVDLTEDFIFYQSMAYTYTPSSSPVDSCVINQQDDTYDLFYNQLGTSNSIVFDSSIPVFSSLDDGLSAVRDFINNPPSSTSLYEGFRLPAGYAAAIQGSNVSFDLAVDMPEYSSIKQWAYSTQRYGLESSLPSVASFDYDYGTRIIWSVVGDTNLLGEGYHASASLSQSVGSGYLMLVNPTYFGSTASIMSADMFNGAVTLSNVSGVTSIRLYSLGSYIGSGGITSDITTNGAIHGGAVISSGGAFFIDNGDGTFTPINSLPDYGDTSVDGSNSGLIAKFRALLEGFVESIESLLIAPVSYIQRIIAAGQTFFTWLSGLWTWLPADVSGILTAVLYVMAVVGALKLLWR